LEKVSIFVDVQNIYYTTKQIFNCHFDYNAFWAEVTSKRKVVAAYAYAIDRNDRKQAQFQNILRGIGFQLKLKPYITRRDGTAKGDWDVGIALDVIEQASHCDTIVLASGDGDFDLLVARAIKNYKVNVEVYSVEPLTAQSLIKEASKYIPVSDKLLLRN